MDMEDFEDIFDDDLDILDIIVNGFPRRVNDRRNFMDELDNFTFFRRFHLTKESVLQLLLLIEEDLVLPNEINNAVSPLNRLLACLRFYSSAGHLSAIADYSGVAISSSSRIIKKVSEAIARLRPMFVKMPTAVEVIEQQNKFYRIASFPRVLGLMDCTHIRIQSPGGDDAELFRNRKSYFSINTQVLCNAELKILDIVARWPGSVHDATIFNNSNIKTRFDNGEFPNSFILGDSGYPLRPYFLTPLANPLTQAEQLYNESHIRTRNGVERLFGVWKRKFPVVAYGMRLKLETVLTVISATAVLHNFAVEMNEPDLPRDDLNLEELDYLIQTGQVPNVPIPEENIPPYTVRSNLITNYFANL